MPLNHQVSPLEHLVLSVKMATPQADMYPTLYQVMLVACHRTGMPVDPCRLPPCAIRDEALPVLLVSGEASTNYGDLRIGRGGRFLLEHGGGSV